MEKRYTRWGKIKNFFKKNIYYVLLILCVAAIGTMITVAVLNGGKETPIDADPYAEPTATATPSATATATPTATTTPSSTPAAAEPIIFGQPVAGATLGNGYSADTLVYSSTLNDWRVHTGIDYMASADNEISAVYGGTVSAIEYNRLDGNILTIDHGEGLSTRYVNISENIPVTVGQTVAKGELIGYVANSGLFETADGPHLHLEAVLNGETVDPMAYFEAEGNK